MKYEYVSTFFYHSMKIMLMLLSPLLLSMLFVGLFFSILQSVIQINEQMLSFLPKFISIFFVSIFFGPWMLHIILDYMKTLFENIPILIFYLC